MAREQGTVYVLDEARAIEKKFKSAVTDSGSEVRRAEDKPGVSNLIEILAAVRGQMPEEVEDEMQDARYGELKGAVATAVIDYLAPVRERYADLRADEGKLEAILADGAERALGRSPARRLRTCASVWVSARAGGVAILPDRYGVNG